MGELLLCSLLIVLITSYKLGLLSSKAMVTKSPVGLPGLSLKHLFTLECEVGTPLVVGDGGMGELWQKVHAHIRNMRDAAG